jgi:hypothetical protein
MSERRAGVRAAGQRQLHSSQAPQAQRRGGSSSSSNSSSAKHSHVRMQRSRAHIL